MDDLEQRLKAGEKVDGTMDAIAFNETFGHLAPDVHLDTTVFVGGLVAFRNRMGKAIFFRLNDGTGRVQVYYRKGDRLQILLSGPEHQSDLSADIDVFETLKDLNLGDKLAVSGTVFTTRTGEVTVQAQRIHILRRETF